MIQTTCPSCQKKLKVGENLQGKQIRCPACQNVFRVEAPAAAVAEVEVAPPRPAPRPAARPAPPPPPPAEEDPFDMVEQAPVRPVARGGPRRRPEPEPDGDFEDLAEPGFDLKQSRRVARRGANALMMALLFDLIAWVIFAVMLFSSGGRGNMGRHAELGMALVVVLSVLYFIPLIFMGLASSMLSSLRGRSLVITGCIMAFIIAVELIPYAGVWGLAVSSALSVGVPINLMILPLLLLCTTVLGLVTSISAGVRGLVTLGKPAVKAGYGR